MERPSTYALASVGLAKGIWEVYVKPEPAKYAWVAIGASVLAYDLLCPEGQTLSEGVDKALEKHPVATTLAIGVTALHLLNRLPAKLDPFVISNNLR